MRLKPSTALALSLWATCAAAIASLCAGPEGWAWPGAVPGFIVWEIRAPRTAAAWLLGALLGWAGAVAQGLFRNPLADPYLLGSASGASLAVVLVLAAGGGALASMGLVAAAFVGALAGIVLTLALARGAAHTPRLLLAGVVVGVMLGAASEGVASYSPEVLRARQVFLLGSTAFVGWGGVGWLAMVLGLALPLGLALARVLDALALGEDTARSLGLPVSAARMALVGLLALATGVAVAQAGLLAFVGLVAPHAVRGLLHLRPGAMPLASALAGGLLLLLADLGARTVLAPQELPVGVLTATLGGAFLLWRLHRSVNA